MNDFVDLGVWLEPPRFDGETRRYEPFQVVRLGAKGTLRSLAELLQADPAYTLPCDHISGR